MASIYQQILGPEFDKLHPQIQRRFGFSSSDGMASIGTGVMDRIWHGAPYTLPFLYVGSWRHIMFPEQATNAPFTIQNYAYCDELGRETVTWIRTFHTTKTRRFDAYMIHSPRRDCIIDYMGTHQHLAVDIHLSVDDRGGICLRSGAQRLYEGALGFRFPLFFSGIADVCEWYDDDIQKFCIDVNVHNPVWGPLFGYHGTFDVQWLPATPDTVPANIKPLRLEKRE